jgi:hydroxymethylpyrimidine/phosphomethylpyrimidine kinase
MLDPIPAEPRIPRVLSIAGSDSGGGAGIQADLKAFAACGVHGMTAITAITAQNTLAVEAVHQVPAEIILAQVRALARDIGIDAVKIGMLGEVETIEAVRAALDELPEATPVVLDPVMVAESGARLLEAGAARALLERLIPRADVITPNLPEARALLAARGEGAELPDEQLPVALHRLGAPVVIVTGGHREPLSDLFYDGRELVELAGVRHPGGAAHGSGCTHSSVLAARLAWGDQPLQAARAARALAARAVAHGLVGLGAGAGPVDVLGLSGAPPNLWE